MIPCQTPGCSRIAYRGDRCRSCAVNGGPVPKAPRTVKAARKVRADRDWSDEKLTAFFEDAKQKQKW